ncbi:unnamed protein product [Bathycoccus prasinos]
MSALCNTLFSSRGSILYAPSSSPTSLERRRRCSGRCSSSGKSSSSGRRKLSVVNRAVPDGVRYEYTSDDERFMLRAIELANTVTYEEHTNPNPIVGCVLVDPSTNEIVGEGYHPKAGEPHAEVHALRAAGKKAKGATAYVTLEPCNHFGRTAACSRALVDAGVKRVLIGAYDTDPRVAGGGMKTLLDRGIEVVCGCKEREATEMNRAFFDRIEKERLEKEEQTRRRNKT